MNQTATPIIAFINHTARMGGGEVALVNLVMGMDRARYSPHVIVLSDGPLVERLRSGGISVTVVPLSADVLETRKDSLSAGSLGRGRVVARSLAGAWRLYQSLRKLRPAIVHTNSLKADLIGGLAAKLCGLPLIWHVRDRIAEDYLPKPAVFVFRQLARLMPDHLIANSRATAETIGAGNGRDKLQNRINAIHDGIAADLFDHLGHHVHAIPSVISVDLFKQLSHFPRTDALCRPLTITLLGRIAPWKGQHVFIEAAERVIRGGVWARFQIVGSALFGEDDYAARLEHMIHEAGLQPHVSLLGFRSDVAEVLAGTDILVHASTTPEPFGQVVIEGMAAGCAVIATRGGGVVETVKDGETGLLVSMGNVDELAAAMTRVIADHTLRLSLGRNGREAVAKHFLMPRTVEKVMAVYDDILARRTVEAECLA